MVESESHPTAKAHDMPLSLEDLDSSLTFEQAMDRLHVSRTTLKRIIADGQIGVVRIGAGRGHPRIPERSLLEYINRRYEKPTDPPKAPRA